MSTMTLIRSKLAATLLSQIGEADYIEGLSNAIQELAEADGGDYNEDEVTQIVRLYDWLENARTEYIALRAEVNIVLEAQSSEADTAP